MNYSEQSKSRAPAQAIEPTSTKKPSHGAPPGGYSDTLARAIARWVDAVGRRAWPVLIATVLSTVALGYYAATNLGMHTDTTEMLSEKLEWRQNYEAYKASFPKLLGNIVVVVEGVSPDLAEDAARALAERLRATEGVYQYVLYFAGDPFFRENGMLFLDIDELQDVADRLADAQPLLSTLANDMSLRGLFEVLGEAADEVMDGGTDPGPLVRVFDVLGDGVESVVEDRTYAVSWRDLMRGEPSEISDRRRFLLVKPSLERDRLWPAKTALDTIRQSAAELALDEAHGVRVRLTGSAALRQEELKSVRTGATTAGIIALVLVALLLAAALRSAKLVAATLATLVVGLVWTAAFAAVAIGYLNLISVTFAVLFFGLAVDFGIQFSLRYRENVANGAANAEALRDAGANVGTAIALAGATSAVGFLAFVPTAYVGLAELGIIAGAGMFIALFLYLTVLPAILALLPIAKPRRGGGIGLPRLAGVVELRPRPIIWAAVALGAAALLVVPSTRFDFDPIKLKDPNTESVQTFLDLTRDSDSSPYTIGVARPDLDAARALAERLAALPEVDEAITIANYVPKKQDEKLEIIEGVALLMIPIFEFPDPAEPPGPAEEREALDEFRGKLTALAASPEAGELEGGAARLADLLTRFAAGAGAEDAGLERLSDVLLRTLPERLESLRLSLEARPVRLDDLPQALRERMLSADGRALIEVFPVAALTDQDALRAFVDAVRTVAPDATDSPVVMLEAGDAVVAAFKQAGGLAFVVIVAMLLATLRSVRDTAVVLMPLVLAGLLMMATMVAFDLAFNLANVIALPLLLALGVDFSIHLTLRHREDPANGAVLRSSTARAVLYSALTTMCSFGSLAVSSHRGIASMGYLLAIALTMAILCTLIVLPAVLARRSTAAAGA